MGNDRRIANKAKEPVKVVGAENITKQPELTVEERLSRIEKYIAVADPYIRSVTEIQSIKQQIVGLNDEITRIAGVQSRANNYIDGKFAYIDQMMNSLAIIVKKNDEDFKSLMSDVEYVDESSPSPSEELYEENPEEKK